jgi:hypothetical protein
MMQVTNRQGDQAAAASRADSGPLNALLASASAKVAAEGFRLSTIELGMRIVAPLSFVVS